MPELEAELGQSLELVYFNSKVVVGLAPEIGNGIASQIPYGNQNT